MRTYDDDTSWPAMRKDLRYTVSLLRATGAHPAELKEMEALLARWYSLDKAMTDAEDGVVDANAKVAWCDASLDRAIETFARDLEHAVEGRRDDLTFATFFPEPPHVVIRMALESELDRTAHFARVAGEVELTPKAKKSLQQVEEARARGREALTQRSEAEAAEASISVRVRRFKEDANAARRSVYNALERHAIDRKLDDDHADLFFLATPRRKSKPRKAPDAKPADAPKGPAAPNGSRNSSRTDAPPAPQ